MADKFLTEAEWKKFAKGRDLKDTALLKALAAFEKAKEPDDQLKALALIEKEADALRKFVKGDKDFSAQLDGIDKAIGKEEKAAKAAQKEAEAKESESEGEDAPDMLTTKMIPLLRQVKQGEEMQVLIARGSKEVAVMMSRRSISPSRRKLLSDYLAEGTPKFDKGVCIFEENAYTFVLETQASGLAKKIKAALFKQVELHLKVRVRGEEGDLDDDGEEAVDELEHEESTGSPQAKTEPTIPEPPPLVDPLKAQFDKRWADLEPQVLAVLKTGAGDASKIRAVAEFVREKGEGSNFKAALQGMDSLEKLLPGAQPNPSPGHGGDPSTAFKQRLMALMEQAKPLLAKGSAQGQAIKLKLSEAGVLATKKNFADAGELLDAAEALLKKGEQEGGEHESEQGTGTMAGGGKLSLVKLGKARLAWRRDRLHAVSEIHRLQGAVAKDFTGEPEQKAALDAALSRLDKLIGSLTDELDDSLDKVLNAAEPARAGLAEQARALMRRFLDHIETDEVMQELDGNEVLPDMSVCEPLQRSLADVAASLG